VAPSLSWSVLCVMEYGLAVVVVALLEDIVAVVMISYVLLVLVVICDALC
jgi:hypothetical protein